MMDEDTTLDCYPAYTDEILPAEKFSTYLRHEPVKLRLNTDGTESEKPISVPKLLLKTVKRHGHGKALGKCVCLYFGLGKWETNEPKFCSKLDFSPW